MPKSPSVAALGTNVGAAGAIPEAREHILQRRPSTYQAASSQAPECLQVSC